MGVVCSEATPHTISALRFTVQSGPSGAGQLGWELLAPHDIAGEGLGVAGGEQDGGLGDRGRVLVVLRGDVAPRAAPNGTGIDPFRRARFNIEDRNPIVLLNIADIADIANTANTGSGLLFCRSQAVTFQVILYLS